MIEPDPKLLLAYFKPEVFKKLEANTEVFKTIIAGKQILSYGEGYLYCDNRIHWVARAIYLEPKDVEWTFQNILWLIKASHCAPKKISSNLELLELAGKIQLTYKFYFRQLKILANTYSLLGDEGSQLQVSLNKIRSNFFEPIKNEVAKTFAKPIPKSIPDMQEDFSEDEEVGAFG